MLRSGELPLNLCRKKLMANHALRSIVTQNKSVNNKYFISNGRKSSEVSPHDEEKGISTPVETIEFLLPRDLLRDIVEEALTTSPWRLKMLEIDTSNLSVAADNPLKVLIAREKIEDLKGNLLCHTDASKTLDDRPGIGIFIPEKQVDISLRTSSHNCISSTELTAIEECLLQVKDSYQGENFNVVILSTL